MNTIYNFSEKTKINFSYSAVSQTEQPSRRSLKLGCCNYSLYNVEYPPLELGRPVRTMAISAEFCKQ